MFSERSEDSYKLDQGGFSLQRFCRFVELTVMGGGVSLQGSASSNYWASYPSMEQRKHLTHRKFL